MSQIEYIDARDAFAQIKNSSALLVCAYERDDKFHRLHLEGAMPLSESSIHTGVQCLQIIWGTHLA